MAGREGTEGKKKTSSQRQKEEEKRERSVKLNAQKESFESRLAAVQALLGSIEMPDLQGMEVEHTQYGPGTVISQKETVITVRYGDTEKKQKIPFAVAEGFLRLPDKEMETNLTRMDDLMGQKNVIEKEIHYLTSLLEDLEKQ